MPTDEEAAERPLLYDQSQAAILQLLVEKTPTYPIIHLINKDVKTTIDTALTWEQLNAPDINFSIVRPLAHKYGKPRNIAILYCLLLNRIKFIRDSEADLAFQSVNQTRAALCELLAIKLLRLFSDDDSGLLLVTAVTASFSPFAGAPEEVREELERQDKEGMLDEMHSALELAIVSTAKKFVKSPLCQKVVDGIWTGKVVYSQVSTHAVLADNYKKRPLSIYEPDKAPLLDHYRLRVPSIRSKLEFCNFIILLSLFVWALSYSDLGGHENVGGFNTAEMVFIVWLLGFALDEFASTQQHGLRLYVNNIWNVFDTLFILISFCYIGFRISGIRHADPELTATAFDILASGAVLLCPRVASVFVQDNVVLLSLRAMLRDFIFFMCLAAICFSGFLFAFITLSGDEWSVKGIVWMMLRVWLGNNFLGLETAKTFHPVFGPLLMVIFAIVANTLLLTVLISLLSNTFAAFAANGTEEALFSHAAKTVEMISSDSLFAYQPPLNLLAVVIILPASYVLSPRWLHKINVLLIRVTSFPILLIIGMIDRYRWRQRLADDSKKTLNAWGWTLFRGIFDGFKGVAHSDMLDRVFQGMEGAFERSGWDAFGTGKSTPMPTETVGVAARRDAWGGSAFTPRRSQSTPSYGTVDVRHDDDAHTLHQDSHPSTPIVGSPISNRDGGDPTTAGRLPSLQSPLAKLFGRPARGPRGGIAGSLIGAGLSAAHLAGASSSSRQPEEEAADGHGGQALTSNDAETLAELKETVDRLKDEDFMGRFGEMEERQRRIEELLHTITQNLTPRVEGK